MAGRLVNALGSSALAAEAFSDFATLRHMLRFEAALAQAAADAGLIPKKFAPVIVKACDPALYDPASLAEAARRTATLTVPVVKALADEVAKRDADAAGYVHWGATSQDVIDTAMVLQLGEALPPIVKELDRIVAAFAALARKHRRTPTLGRTLLQPAKRCRRSSRSSIASSRRLPHLPASIAGRPRSAARCCSRRRRWRSARRSRAGRPT